MSYDQNAKVQSIVSALRNAPDEAFTRMQYLQPEVGCFNSCGFCSQEAGGYVWQLTDESLKNLLSAISIVAEERNIEVASGRVHHRAGVIFPYLDNDIFSYPHLDTYLSGIRDNLGAKVRVATVGFSRHNERLVRMHEQIVSTYADTFAGIRLSYTPYTAGFAAESGTKLSKEEFEADAAFFLGLYRQVFEYIGYGKSTACVELRFHPDVHQSDVLETFVDGHHMIAVGPHVLIGRHSTNKTPPIAHISRVAGAVAHYDIEPTPYWFYTNDQHVASVGPIRIAELMLIRDASIRRFVKEVPLYQFENVDGPYYAISPDFRTDGKYVATHIYPISERRSVSGYNNASRHFLNALLRIKGELGYARREKFDSATWEDVQLVIDKLNEQVEVLQNYDVRTALHINRHILPLVKSYVKVLIMSGYEPSMFFNPDFTIDTGQIVNQGRARKFFKNLVTIDDEPLTPREARAYGDIRSVSAQRGKIWRIVPIPSTSSDSNIQGLLGGKTVLGDQKDGGVILHEVSEHTLRPIDHKTKRPLRKFVIPNLEVNMVSRHEGWRDHRMPGTIKKDSNDG